MRVLVLGAGVIGVTSAWFLREAGHSVCVVERGPGAGLETSFANGAQISVGQAEPWARPAALLNILRWLGREDAPLRFRLRADVDQWRWALRFLRECTPARARDNVTQLVRLGAYSLRALQALRAETGIQYDQSCGGILIFFTDSRQYEAASAQTRRMRELGCDREMKTVEECLAIEPALLRIRDRLVGGAYTPTDEAGDAGKFTAALADLAAARGVEFRYGTSVRRLLGRGDEISGVEVVGPGGERQELKADAHVVSLGSYSPQLLRSLRLTIPVYPVKGYSVTVPIRAGEAALRVSSLTDDERKIVFSRIGSRLRVAGIAELSGYNTDIDPARCEAMLHRAGDLFPDVGDHGQVQYWAGLRPGTPDNVPLIGRTRYRNLYLNTGHGTLGWTLACGSGRALADLLNAKTPEVEFRFLGSGIETSTRQAAK